MTDDLPAMTLALDDKWVRELRACADDYPTGSRDADLHQWAARAAVLLNRVLLQTAAEDAVLKDTAYVGRRRANA